MLTNNDYEVQKNEVVDGNVRIVHGDLVVNGIVNGDASTVTGDMEINGHVLGNAVAVSGDISLGPDAVVEGDVQSVRGDIVRAPGATVHGAIRNDSNTVANVGNGRVESAMFESPLNLPLVIVLMLAGMAMLVAWPRRVDTVGRAFVNRPGHSFVVGLASFPLAVLAIVISAVTIVGPVMVVFGFIGAFLMGVVAMALMLGRRMVLGKPYKSRFFPLLVGLGVWFAATVVSHVSTPLFVLMTISTAIAYLMAIGATLSTGFGKSPFWLRDRMAGRNKVGGSYIDPTQTYAGTADAFGDVI
jgi:cytoskeletal protein CcmA (bactofilin family)